MPDRLWRMVLHQVIARHPGFAAQVALSVRRVRRSLMVLSFNRVVRASWSIETTRFRHVLPSGFSHRSSLGGRCAFGGRFRENSIAHLSTALRARTIGRLVIHAHQLGHVLTAVSEVVADGSFGAPSDALGYLSVRESGFMETPHIGEPPDVPAHTANPRRPVPAPEDATDLLHVCRSAGLLPSAHFGVGWATLPKGGGRSALDCLEGLWQSRSCLIRLFSGRRRGNGT